MRLRRSGIITKIVVLALVLYAITSIMSLRVKIDDAKAEQKAEKQQVTESEINNAELEYKVEVAKAMQDVLRQQVAENGVEDKELKSKYDEVIADIARELGYVMPGEIVAYSGDAP